MSLGLVWIVVGRVEHRLRRTGHLHCYPKVGFGEEVVPSAYFPCSRDVGLALSCAARVKSADDKHQQNGLRTRHSHGPPGKGHDRITDKETLQAVVRLAG